jgi:hypothetical protein
MKNIFIQSEEAPESLPGAGFGACAESLRIQAGLALCRARFGRFASAAFTSASYQACPKRRTSAAATKR